MINFNEMRLEKVNIFNKMQKVEQSQNEQI